MTFELIDNLSASNNHSVRIKKLFENSHSVIIASPFLMQGVSGFFEDIDFSELKEIQIITTLKPNSFDQIKKIDTLISLIEFPSISNKKIRCQISINNKLHGKVYIFKRNGEYISAIISSANFTDSGLSWNHEWGVEIFDHNEIEKLEKSILSNIDILNITRANVYEMREVITDFITSQPKSEANDIGLDLIRSLNLSATVFVGGDKVNFWLKPIGVSNRPVTEDRLFGEMNTNLHFSKKRPNQVKPNDIIITYGVGVRKILSVYRVTTYPIRSNEEEIEDDEWLERWPWYVKADNLSPTFGSTWYSQKLFISTLREEFLSNYPQAGITAVGGKTLGGFNFGQDKLRLSLEFAKFIIDKVMYINRL